MIHPQKYPGHKIFRPADAKIYLQRLEGFKEKDSTHQLTAAVPTQGRIATRNQNERTKELKAPSLKESRVLSNFSVP